jgi:Protein  of unknown function (DUF3018)
MGVHQPLSSRERVARHRAEMRAKGLRLKQIWVRDVKSEAFKEQARRDCIAINNSPHAGDDMAFIESQIDFNDWPEWKDD